MKTIVFISDLHAGSVFGLTPPEYWEADDARREMQKEAWHAYHKIVKKWSKPDFLCVNADCIDGSQAKMGGAELTTPDRNIQAEMAEEAISMWDAGQILMTYGSTYHVSSGAEDFEYNIAHRVNAKIGGRLNFEIEGIEFDMRHKVGSSGIPHGRATPLLREMMWNLIKDGLEGDAPKKLRVVVRSHVHYHMWVEQPGRVMFTTPCLQLSRGRYGSRECVGETHWGAMRLTVKDGQIINKEVEICSLQANRLKLLKLK
jgi:hypothetical protein